MKSPAFHFETSCCNTDACFRPRWGLRIFQLYIHIFLCSIQSAFQSPWGSWDFRWWSGIRNRKMWSVVSVPCGVFVFLNPVGIRNAHKRKGGSFRPLWGLRVSQ